MARRLTREQQILWRQIRQGIQRIDETNARMVAEILDVVRRYPASQLTDLDRRALMNPIIGILDRYFGITQASAPNSEMYRAMLQVMDTTSSSVYERAYQRFKADVVKTKGQPVWEHLERTIRYQPVHANDKLQTVQAMLDGDRVAKTRLLRSRSLDPQRRWVPRDRWNTQTGYRLSDRLWKIGHDTRMQIDEQLRQMVKDGVDPIKAAKLFEQHLNDNARSMAKYDSNGRIIKRINQTKAPRGGWGNVAARRLVRTELVRVNGAATIESAKAVPGVLGIQWRLSNRHEDDDDCTDMATQNLYGMGAGVYPVDAVPDFPKHPNDICTLGHVYMEREAFVDATVAKYLGEAGLAV